MNISVWYHCVLSGERIHDENHALSVMSEQMNALNLSGLSAMADEIHIGVNGPDTDAFTVAAFTPSKAQIHINGAQAQSEIPTLQLLREYLKPNCLVLYHHIKGVQYPNNPVWDRWRRCMQDACVMRWKRCVELIEKRGIDTVGAHWMDSSTYPIIPSSQRYWGGNFWWANSNYLLSLPPLPQDSHEARYEAEVWIGKSNRKPRVFDMVHHFPMSCV